MSSSLACDRATELVSRSQDRSLTVRQRFALWFHLRTCYACKLFQKQVRLLSATIRIHRKIQSRTDYPQSPGLSPDARERIKRKLSKSDQ